MQIAAIWFKYSTPRCIKLEWVYLFGESNSLATLNTNKPSSIFHYTNSSLHLPTENKHNTHKHTHTQTFKVHVGFSTHSHHTSKRINRHQLLFPMAPTLKKKIFNKADLSAHAKLHHLVYCVCYIGICESASAQHPSSCHYFSPLYCCQNHRWQATFPGRSAQILFSANAAGAVIWRR